MKYRAYNNGERGAALLELALVFGIVIPILSGIITFTGSTGIIKKRMAILFGNPILSISAPASINWSGGQIDQTYLATSATGLKNSSDYTGCILASVIPPITNSGFTVISFSTSGSGWTGDPNALITSNFTVPSNPINHYLASYCVKTDKSIVKTLTPVDEAASWTSSKQVWVINDTLRLAGSGAMDYSLSSTKDGGFILEQVSRGGPGTASLPPPPPTPPVFGLNGSL